MIRNWLLKHRFVSEGLKILIVAILLFFAFVSWGASKLVGAQVNSENFYVLTVFGIVIGFLVNAAISLLVGVVYSVIDVIGKNHE